MKIKMNYSKTTKPMKDTLSLSKILKSCKAGDTFLTTSPDKEVIAYACKVGCKVTTQRRQMINLNMIEGITFVTVVKAADEDIKAIFPRRKKQKI